MATLKQKRNRKNSFNSKKNREIRLAIVAEYYRHGRTYREICTEVKNALGLQSLSLQTIHADVQYLLEEWRKYRIEDVDAERQLALERINEMMREAWKAYEKSKEDYIKKRDAQFGKPKEDGSLITVGASHTTEDVRAIGDPKWLELILKLQQERNKIFGVYAPEKKELSGSLSFEQLLMETSQET